MRRSPLRLLTLLLAALLLLGACMPPTSNPCAGCGEYSFDDGSGHLDGIGTAARLDRTVRITVDPSNNLIVLGNTTLRKITPAAHVSTWLTSVSPQPNTNVTNDSKPYTFGVAKYDAAGNLIFVDGQIKFVSIAAPSDNLFYFLIRKLTPAGRLETVLFSERGLAFEGVEANRLGGVSGLTLSATGEIFVSDPGNHRICLVSADGKLVVLAGSSQFLSHVPGYQDGKGSEALFHTPSGLVFTASGSLLVADQGNHRIREIQMDGTVSTFAGTGNQGFEDGPASEASFYRPNELAFDSRGNLYVADTGLRKITSDGQVTTIIGSASVTVEGFEVTSVAVDHDDTVYFSDRSRIMRLRPDGQPEPFAGQKFWPPKKMSF